MPGPSLITSGDRRRPGTQATDALKGSVGMISASSKSCSNELGKRSGASSTYRQGSRLCPTLPFCPTFPVRSVTATQPPPTEGTITSGCCLTWQNAAVWGAAPGRLSGRHWSLLATIERPRTAQRRPSSGPLDYPPPAALGLSGDQLTGLAPWVVSGILGNWGRATGLTERLDHAARSWQHGRSVFLPHRIGERHRDMSCWKLEDETTIPLGGL